jgi:acyl-CoA synthetase (AMP-forming)/AMP-acid ligase II
VEAATAGLGLPAPVAFGSLVDGAEPAPRPYPAAEFALLQFTSGSSGSSRGVLVTNSALRANVSAMREWLQWKPEYPGIAWLPVHHDMGLIGCLINIVTTGCDGWMMQPEDFIRSPLRYLRCISDNKVGLAAMPNFGLAYILRRVRPADLAGLSFGSIRSVILGAERIDPQVLESFDDLLRPHGFHREALKPAYGGAEATLAVTGLPLGEGWSAVVPEGATDSRIVGCGRPLAGITVSVVDDEGAAVPDRTVGEILVTGTSVATRYVGDPGSASGTALDGGVLRTGDAGFRHEGQLFVVGRLGDGLKVRGRMVFAETLESQLHAMGIPERRVAVLLGHRDGRATGVAVLEKPAPDWEPAAHQVLSEALGDANLLVAQLPRGGLAVTSSGKPRRRVMWSALCDGRINGEVRELLPV